MKKNIIGKTLVLTTTNGTKAINLAKGNKIITASYINFHSVVNYLKAIIMMLQFPKFYYGKL